MGDWNTTKVLDHGFVHLRDSMPSIWSTRVVDGLGAGDYRIEEAARVSTSHLPMDVQRSIGVAGDYAVTRTSEQTKKLIKYMFDNSHTTPFEMVRLTYVVKAPIFVERQAVRHRMAGTNEQSARYSKLPCEFYVPSIDRMQEQSTTNKQGSGALLDEEQALQCIGLIRRSAENAYRDYESMLNSGLTRELARMVLSTNFYTQKFWTIDLHNFMGFCRQRCDGHAQWEIRQYANAMLSMAEHVAPYVISLFREKHGLVAA
jgi:thymidylate synthase (FAD)